MSEGLIYTAPLHTWKSSALSVLTLSAIFLFALFYLFLVPLFLYYYVWSVFFWILLSTIWWHKLIPSLFNNYEYWRSNRVFEAWRSYFGLRIYCEDYSFSPPEEGRKNVLYTFVPHGLFPFGLVLVSGILFKDRRIKIGIASNMFYIPVFCILLRLLGCVEANADIFNKDDHQDIVLVPDGIAGAFYSDRRNEVLYLRKREGFIREAIRHNYDIVPVYCFGHTQLYDIYGWKELSRRFRFALIWFWGRSSAIWLPHARNVSVVVGQPLVVPPREEKEQTHWRYLKAVKDLYDKYRTIVPDWDGKKELKIV
jgi:hypothetical protein